MDMGLPTVYRVSNTLVFLTAERLASLLKEVLPNWSPGDVLWGKALDGETAADAVAKIEAALTTKLHAQGHAEFHANWVRFELTSAPDIRRNVLGW